MLVSNRQDGGDIAIQVVAHRVGKAVEYMEMNAILVGRPHVSTLGQFVNGSKHVRTKGIRSNRTALEVPHERIAELLLRFWQKLDRKPTHMALMRARASAQGTTCAVPERRSARRRNSSARQASATVASSLVSRLSMRAAATAERSSAESRRTSSRTWSTRAFMSESLTLQHAQRRLTPRSSGAPTAWRLARAAALFIIYRAGQAPHRRCPLNSHVRRRKETVSLACLQPRGTVADAATIVRTLVARLAGSAESPILTITEAESQI